MPILLEWRKLLDDKAMRHKRFDEMTTQRIAAPVTQVSGGTEPALLKHRRQRLERMLDAIPALKSRLAAYAAENSGRFILYGSLTRGAATIESDVDVLADFPDDLGWTPCLFAEEEIAKAGWRADVRPIGFCSPSFLDAIAKGQEVLS